MRILFILRYNSAGSNNWRCVQAQEQSGTGMGGGKDDVSLSHDCWWKKNAHYTIALICRGAASIEKYMLEQVLKHRV